MERVQKVSALITRAPNCETHDVVPVKPNARARGGRMQIMGAVKESPNKVSNEQK